jgi:hypothetical protein
MPVRLFHAVNLTKYYEIQNRGFTFLIRIYDELPHTKVDCHSHLLKVNTSVLNALQSICKDSGRKKDAVLMWEYRQKGHNKFHCLGKSNTGYRLKASIFAIYRQYLESRIILSQYPYSINQPLVKALYEVLEKLTVARLFEVFISWNLKIWMFASAHYEPRKPGSNIISLRHIL